MKEENKVATKLKQIIHDSYWDTSGEKCTASPESLCCRMTDAILQSPDLRVTLVPVRFVIEDEQCGSDKGRFFVRDNSAKLGDWRGRGYFLSQKWAQEYADWLNSKDPK